MKDHNLFSVIPYKDQLIKLENPIRAFAYYKNYAVNLLTGEKKSRSISEWVLETSQKKISSVEENPRVIHLFYELGFFIEKELNLIADDTLLAIDCEFKNYHEIKEQTARSIHLEKISTPDKGEYKKAFDKGYEELLAGNCYQFNLTYPFLYSFKEDYSPEDFIFALWRKPQARGAFGSATYIPYFQKLFLSNSPECLFQYKQKTLSSMPIKGTLKRVENENWKPLWKKLVSDKKSQAELFMISDLLRNDLSRIEKPRAQIVKKKYPKLVPGLIHQYSQIDVELSDDVNLWRVIEKIFPGGSITGAPKVRAMKLIHELEKRNRGFYCGSTLILLKEMKSASINIRSSEISFSPNEKKLLYQAGGGITLLSNVFEEYCEMTYKHDSFISTLTL